MKMFTFSLQQMIDSLNKLGYLIVEEDVVLDNSRSNTYKDEQHYINYAVYRNGVRMVDYLKPGTAEVEFAFRSELHDRVLKLF